MTGPQSSAEDRRSAAHGEFELINELAALFGQPPEGLGIGDDAATWATPEGLVSVGTTDMLVEGIHFRLDWASPEDVGWKALAVNLSDLAAMGSAPGRALVSVAVDPERRELVPGVARGLQAIAARTGTVVVGGDTVRSPGPLVVNVALVGSAAPERLLRRDAARPGDVLAVTGRLGGAAAALAALLDGHPLNGADAQPLLDALHRPTPRLVAGRALAEAGVCCAIDISDGLASEAAHIAEASRVSVVVDLAALPLFDAAVRALGPDRARQLAATGGEDYELLFAADPDRLRGLANALADCGGLTVVGRVEGSEHPGRVTFLDGSRPVTLAEKGYVAF
ncbi:MAG TPA: thiamine-phosphate kinase [Candidatus Limnocylindrales bacterium]